MLFAQINGDKLCYARSDLSGYVQASDLIPVEAGTDCLGKRWEDGAWVAVEPVAEPEASAPVTLTELAENQLIIMQALADLYEGGLTNG